MIKFGIYTSFYNCERFIDKIFSSIELINYDNFEWHITDDFSTDNTKQKILNRLEISSLKNKIKYFEQTEKKQMYWKPNLFFDTTFEWIVLIDADDDFDKNFLRIYNSFLKDRDDLTLITSDCHKIYDNNKKLHSISYILNDDNIPNKLERYHPSCDYLNNISYSCFGLLRCFKNIITSFDIDDMLACAEDSYHVFWSNSYGKYLHIPRPLYVWYLREDSESHSKSIPPNFNGNFNIALNKLKKSDGGVDKMFNDVYIETSTLASYDFGNLQDKKVSLWTRSLPKGNKEIINKLYPDVDLSFNDIDAEVHLFALNYFDEYVLDSLLNKLHGKKMLFYYQDQKFHSTHEEKDSEVKRQLESYKKIISKHTGYSWWVYVRHFIIKN